jgi:hypothetical protein
MSLIDEMREGCVLLTKTRVSDGLGGYIVVWEEGVTFYPAFQYDGSTAAIVAEKQGLSRSYSIYVPRSMELDYHDVFRRLSDGATFRVTNPGVDRNTPQSAALDLRLIECERWELT